MTTGRSLGTVAAIVVARGGSKGLPGKNVAPCGGRPLVAWSVVAARGAAGVHRVLVSTDDEAIRRAAIDAGAAVPSLRPAALATDDASVVDVVEHALALAGEGVATGVLLQATSPLRTAADIDGALAVMAGSGAPSVVSVTVPAKSPYWMYRLDAAGRMRPLLDADPRTRRQELPETYVLNGAIYAFDVAWFRQHRRFVTEASVAYVMPPERSVDVDGALDLALADLLIGQRQGP